jgi:hypothetical protein
MVESARFGLLLCGDITSDAVLSLSWMRFPDIWKVVYGPGSRFLGFGRLTKNRNVSNDGGL